MLRGKKLFPPWPILSLCLLLLYEGCSPFRDTINYHNLSIADPQPGKDSVLRGKLAVSTFKDYRHPDLEPRPADAESALLRVFFWPMFGFDSRQDGIRIAQDPVKANRKISLAHATALAVAEDIKARRLVEEVVFFPEGEKEEDARWRLVGLIEKADGLTHFYGYLIPVLSPCLWYLGLPAANVKFTIELELKFEDVQAERVFLQKKVRAESVSPPYSLYTALFGVEGRSPRAYYFANTLHQAVDAFMRELVPMIQEQGLS